MRNVGCCTWIFGGAPLSEIAQRASRARLQGVELFGDLSLDPTEARATLSAAGLEVFSITPGDADIAHPDTAIRAAGLDYYEKLMPWAKALGEPLISCHGLVTRIAPVGSQADEDALLVDAVRQVADMAAGHGLNVVFEILNRYETHQIRTVDEGLALLERVGASNLSLLPDAYHMNIEEADPAAALMAGGKAIGLYHAADSNRCGIGEGNTNFAAQIDALNHIGYGGPIILETNAPGPNPFTPDKGDGFRDLVEGQLARSVSKLRELGA